MPRGSDSNNLQVHSIATVTKAVALRDLGKRIEVGARGEILSLKNCCQRNGSTLSSLFGFTCKRERTDGNVGRPLAAEVAPITLEVGGQGKLVYQMPRVFYSNSSGT